METLKFKKRIGSYNILARNSKQSKKQQNKKYMARRPQKNEYVHDEAWSSKNLWEIAFAIYYNLKTVKIKNINGFFEIGNSQIQKKNLSLFKAGGSEAIGFVHEKLILWSLN